ncbi:MAG: PQQ-binding-like beta-propeller repeat protein [Chloroflexota bacterium]
MKKNKNGQKERTVSRVHDTVSTVYRSLFTVYCILFTVSCLLFTALPANGQSTTASYWQYAASGRLRQVIPADVNKDGITEFILVDESGRVTFVNAKGEREWSVEPGSPVTAVGVIPQADPAAAGQAVALGVANELIFLTSYGDELWRIPLTAVTIPISLLTSSGYNTAAAWQDQYAAIPHTILPYDADQDGIAEILVLLDSGQIQLFDQSGALLWRYTRNVSPVVRANPSIEIADFAPDIPGDEILLGRFNPRRFSQLMLIDNQGGLIWEHNLSGRMTALTTISFNDEPHIAAGTSRGDIFLFDRDNHRLWLRTLNKPITSLAAAKTETGPVLIAGVNVGTLVAFNEEGRRLWTQELAPAANYEIQNISVSPFVPKENHPLLAVLLRPNQQREEPADVLLINSEGRILEQLEQIDTTGLSQLVDVNGDGLSELLLSRFATVELQGLGIGSSKVATEWEYPSLFAPPTAVLVTDLNDNNVDDILIGAQDGRLHRLTNDGNIQWIVSPGGAVTHLAIVPAFADEAAHIAVAHTGSAGAPANNTALADNDPTRQSFLELRQENGDELWQQSIAGRITSLLAADLSGRGSPTIIVGSSHGEIHVYDTQGSLLWQTQIDGPVNHILVRENPETRSQQLLVISENLIYAVTPDTAAVVIVNPNLFTEAYLIAPPGTGAATSLAATNDNGFLSLYNERNIQSSESPIPLNGRSLTSLHYQQPAAIAGPEQTPQDALLVATDAGSLLNLHFNNGAVQPIWEMEDLPGITSMFYGNLDEDNLPDIAVGDENGVVHLINEAQEVSGRLNVVSSVFALNPVDSAARSNSDLLVTTDNGLVQLFRAKENRPPLITNPQIDTTQDRASFTISVQDIERDEVTVTLELFDPDTGRWVAQGAKAVNGSGNLVWPGLPLPAPGQDLGYRFRFDDGFHTGIVTPPALVAPLPLPAPQTSSRLVFLGLGVMALGAAAFLWRQMRTPGAQASRFYRRLKQHPDQTLLLLENQYAQIYGAPDFFVNLANEARQQADHIITNLADGLFLLSDRPHAGLSILIHALEEVNQHRLHWEGLARWAALSKTTQLMLDAPSITEISLLRPQLSELLSMLEAEGAPSRIFQQLLPILTNLRDSERVDRTDDRLVYISEANLLTNLLRNHLIHYPITIDRTLGVAVINRLSGLLNAKIEELRGQAELVITLKTKHLLPLGPTEVMLEIANNGRSAAERIMVQLDNNPAYDIHSDPKIISQLPPRGAWQISFTIQPKVTDRFRLSLTITYNDRHKQDRELAFGDMVYLLIPSREFQPIPNPYLPGTPLRQDSPLFYGREDLFAFIEENAARLSQRNVLILFGQRRTGKTSILLRLQQHLPQNILPVYIDCQSLGVTRGMPALLSDLAWQIADALAARKVTIEVPETAVWQQDPTVFFQRLFLPQVQALLPADTIILLVFDEFEAFESLVRDGLLPPTFFTYMRHLMQHSQGLSFMFVGAHRLEEMTADYWSVLFNIALYEKIGYLDQEAMTRLIREPVTPYLVYDDLALDKIRRVTAGHPYFLQLVCYTLVKRANAQRSTYVTISDVNAALDEMILLGEVHFAYIWQRSSFVEKAMLTAVAHLMEADMLFHPEDLMQYLETYGIHLNPNDVTTALTSLAQREILAEVSEGVTTLYELKTGLVGLWVAQHKSLSKLHAEREAEPVGNLRLMG